MIISTSQSHADHRSFINLTTQMQLAVELLSMPQVPSSLVVEVLGGTKDFGRQEILTRAPHLVRLVRQEWHLPIHPH